MATNQLLGKWDLYYHLPQDKNWDLVSYKVIMNNISTVEDTIAINEGLTDHIVKFSMLFAMRSGITPMWEDPKNRTGGCFSFKVLNKQVHEVWKALFYAMCGETLCVNRQYSKFINGITVSPKRSFCIVKIWLANCNYQNPVVISDNLGISSQGCLFKTHIS